MARMSSRVDGHEGRLIQTWKHEFTRLIGEAVL